MAGSAVFIVVCEDRHTDAAITVHATREGADAAVEEFKNRYPDDYEWSEQTYGAPEWVRCIDCHEDGPKAYIAKATIKP